MPIALPWKAIVTWASFTAGFVAAALWWKASTIAVRPLTAEELAKDPWQSAAIIEIDPKGREIDTLLTLKAASRLNALAAIAAGVAAACQALAQVLPEQA